MKTLLRHGLAVLLALSTMCTSLVIMYSNMGNIKVQSSQPPAAATIRSEGKTTTVEDPRRTVLEGYISISEHKGNPVQPKNSSRDYFQKDEPTEKMPGKPCATKEFIEGLCPENCTHVNKPGTPRKLEPLKMHCRSCALVTSSGHLLGSRLGKKIDQTECVIRMNDAPTWGYGQDVGNKTSLRVIAHSSIQRILRNRNELLNMSQGTVFIFWGPSSYMRRDGKGLVYNNLQLINKILPRLKVHIITRHKMQQFDELFKKETGKDRKFSNTWLSTGWFTMSIALELCDTINVYGMVPPDFCRSPNHTSVPYHYYEPLGPDECTMYISHERGRKGSHHRFITEKKVFANWARTFNINFFQPDWKPEAHTSKHFLMTPMF